MVNWEATESGGSMDVLKTGLTIKVSGRKREAFTGLNKRPGALVAEGVTGMMGWLRKEITTQLDQFWMRKAGRMLQLIWSRAGQASHYASPAMGYPGWRKLSDETIKRKARDKRGADEHSEDFWQKYEGVTTWLSEVADGGRQGPNWHTMEPPEHLPYVEYVNDGTAKMPARPLFTFTAGDLQDLERMLDKIVNEALKG